MQTGWQLESSRRQIVCSNFLQCVCRGGSQLPVTAAKKWQGCLFKQRCELEIKLGQRRCFVDFLAKLSFNMQLLEYRFRWSNSSSHFSCSYLPLICLSTNQNIQLIHSLLIRIEWTTGNGILMSSSHWPIYNKFPPDGFPNWHRTFGLIGVLSHTKIYQPPCLRIYRSGARPVLPPWPRQTL